MSKSIVLLKFNCGWEALGVASREPSGGLPGPLFRSPFWLLGPRFELEAWRLSALEEADPRVVGGSTLIGGEGEVPAIA